MFKSQGKSVISNDYMAMSATFTKAMIENSHVLLSEKEAKELLLKKKNPIISLKPHLKICITPMKKTN